MATTPSLTNLAITPDQIDALSRDTLDAETLPPECYWDPELYKLELENIFFKEWQCVGRLEDIPNPGDFLTIQIATEPVIVVRDGEGEIHAHLNVCRHRGCSLVKEGGNAKAFQCPYHGWMYALNGTLRATPDFKETRNFDKSQFSLHSLKVEIWKGFIMVNFDLDAAPFAPSVSNASKWGIDLYRMEDMVTTHMWTYHLDCNWKTYVENYIEEYHIPWIHPETFQLLTPLKHWIEFPELTEGQPWALMVGQNPGLTFSETGDALFPVTPELKDLEPAYDGMPIWLAYPTFMVIPTVDAIVYYVAYPEGPEKTRVQLWLCLPKEGVDAWKAGDPEATKAVEEYANGCEVFIAEDNGVCEMQQVGLRSRHGTAGRFCKHEGLAREFDQWVADKAYRHAAVQANGNGHGNGNGAHKRNGAH